MQLANESMIPVWIGVYGLIVLALIVSEYREDLRAQILLKPVAAFGFCLIALMCGALETQFGQIILMALFACAIGDICLLSRKSNGLFIIGMTAFALGHIGYIFAARTLPRASIEVFEPQINLALQGVIILIVIAGAILIWRYLHNKLVVHMKTPVTIYVIIISLMLLECILRGLNAYWMIAIGAIMFAISDIFVARDRFINPNPKNAWVITPLYFGAQALFALSVNLAV